MIRTLAVLLTLLCHGFSMGQGFGNEWIDHGKRYWTLKVSAEGLYRIDSTTLANAGFPLGTVDPRHFRLFGRNQEVPIFLTGEQDGVFNTADRIEFYAPKPDTWNEDEAWENPAYNINPMYPLFNDTLRYYLTWDTEGPWARVQPYENTDFSSQAPRPWIWGETAHFSPTAYSTGDRTGQGGSLSTYVQGEGYGTVATATTSAGVVLLRNLSTPSPYLGPDAPPAHTYGFVTSSNSASQGLCPDHHIRVTAGPGEIPLLDTIFAGYRMFRFQGELGPGEVVDATYPLRFRLPHDVPPCLQSMAANYPDQMYVGMMYLRYPKVPSFQNQAYVNSIVPDADGETFATISSVTPSGGAPLVYVLGDQVARVVPTVVAQVMRFNVPLSPGGTRIVNIGSGHVRTIGALAPVNGTGYFNDLMATPLDSAVVIVAHHTLLDAAHQYAAYRSISPVAPAAALVVNVDELYDQYGGGIARNPLAIQRFMRHVLATFPTRPKGLFLIGKSTAAHRTGSYTQEQGYRTNAAVAAACLVPPFGNPPSDMLYTMGIAGNRDVMEVPVGRLAARTPEDVLAYLGKVQQYEGQPPAAWMKEILHFRGGSTPGEAQNFNAALNSYQAVAEAPLFTGRVTRFEKLSDLPITGAPADSVRNAIESGVSLMTFFGHAYAQNFDITISEPSAYDWQGRYPVMVGNSCYTGNIHQYNGWSASENFVLQDGLGAIAFMASVDLGLAPYLQPFTRDIYRSFSLLNYGKGLGEHVRHATNTQVSAAPQSMDVRNNVHTFTLHGDPLLVLNSPLKPDLDITEADLVVRPERITAELDSFQVRLAVRNIGRATDIPFAVTLDRRLLNQADEPRTYSRTMTLSTFQDTAVFTLPVVDGPLGAGLNEITLRVDLVPNAVEELDGKEEVNNRLVRVFQIISNDLLPIYPYDFAVVPDPTPVLRASTADPFAPARNYLFQIDTTDAFNSPMMEQVMRNVPGGVVEWEPSNILALNQSRDSTVFYWRTTLDSAGSGLFNWHQRSFQYIPGKRGWGQAHFQQFKANTFNLLHNDQSARSINYFSGTKEIGVSVTGNTTANNEWWIDLVPQDYGGCGDTAQSALHVAVVDPLHFTAWESLYNGVGTSHGNFNINGACRGRVERYFAFRQKNRAQMDSLADMLLNDIPNGHYVVVYTFMRLLKDSVQASQAWGALAAVGAVQLTNGTVPDQVPYAMIFRKGQPGSAIEAWGDHTNASIELVASIPVSARNGGIVAPAAGAMAVWDEFSWFCSSTEPSDSVGMRLVGTNDPGQPATPVGNWAGNAGSIQALNDLVDAAQMPYLAPRAAFANSDPQASVFRPAQLKRWHLLGTPAPECAIDPPNGFFTYMDGVFQGERASAMVAVRNIGDLPMDSLLLAAWVVDGNNQRKLVHYKRNAPLPVGGVLRDTLHFSTLPFPGGNMLIVEANPVDTVTGQRDQLEHYYGNNIATVAFSTVQDKVNPVLDVTFDGIHILDGDIVSAKAEIQVRLEDENMVLLMDQMADTACFKVFLTDPMGNLVQVPFRRGGVDVMRFFPAGGDNNVCRISYQGAFNVDGKYKLQITAKDKSNNTSGTRDHVVHFEVINRATITEVLNYPNPFTTSTRFVFTLTGSEAPTAMRIQIMTITGRVVREIAMHELGPIRVGRNITEYAWDGRDNFGDRLARGVYLYRVVAQLNGEDIEQRETGASTYFRKGVGKMYLL